jgi:hypothetical protein
LDYTNFVAVCTKDLRVKESKYELSQFRQRAWVEVHSVQAVLDERQTERLKTSEREIEASLPKKELSFLDFYGQRGDLRFFHRVENLALVCRLSPVPVRSQVQFSQTSLLKRSE